LDAETNDPRYFVALNSQTNTLCGLAARLIFMTVGAGINFGLLSDNFFVDCVAYARINVT